MWKWLHPYAKPENTYRLCGQLLPWISIIGFVLILVGTVWGLAFAPTDYQQGDSYRIIYWHVPAAIWSMGVYMSMAIASFIGLVWQLRLANMASAAMAPIGAAFTFMTLISGSFWGKPMWGTWWAWDARLTTELILLFIYFGIIALYNAFEDHKTASKASGILTLVGAINIPIIHFSVDWWHTLHQGNGLISFSGKQLIAPSMLWPLMVNIIGFGFVFGALFLVRYRTEILLREGHRPWVRALIGEK